MFYGFDFYAQFGGVVEPIVLKAQNLLDQLGFTGADGNPLKQDGLWGNNTNYALTQFYNVLGQNWGCTSGCRSKLTSTVISDLEAMLAGQMKEAQPPPKKTGTPPAPPAAGDNTMLYVGLAAAAGILLMALASGQQRPVQGG